MAARILFLLDSLADESGHRALVRTLATMDRDAFQPEVAYLWEPSPLTDRLETLDVRVHRVRARRGDWSMLSIPRIRRILVERHVQVIHTVDVWSSIVGRVAGRWAKVRVVSDLGGADADGWVEQVLPPREARRVKATSQLDSLTARVLVDRFIATSQGQFVGQERPSKVTVVPRGQDLVELARRAAAEPNPALDPSGSPLILTAGDLTPPKDQRSLVDAMAIVRGSFPEATLLVVGEGSLRRMLEDRAKPLGAEAVVFLGRRSDVPALLTATDLFVLPSVWEQSGAALVDAMAIGRPIVATRIPTVMDTVRDGETAVLAKAGDPISLSGAILRVLRDPASAAAMGERAASLAERYDVRRTTQQLEAVYREVLSSRKRSGPHAPPA